MDIACPLCECATRLLTYQKTGAVYHSCSACGFLFKNSAHLLCAPEEEGEYARHHNSIDDPAYVRFFMNFLSAVLPLAGPGKAALDFGSGPTPVLATLLERDFGYRCDIYDKFYAPRIPYAGKRYDLITATEVIEHIADPIEVFHLFAALMHKDSLLAVMTLFRPKDDADFIGWHYMRDKTHCSFFTPEAMKLLAHKAGLGVVYSDNARYTSLKLMP